MRTIILLDNFIPACSREIPSAGQNLRHAENRVFIRESSRSCAYTEAQVYTPELHRTSLFEMSGHACRLLNREVSHIFPALAEPLRIAS